jgi:hypothetical protein
MKSFSSHSPSKLLTRGFAALARVSITSIHVLGLSGVARGIITTPSHHRDATSTIVTTKVCTDSTAIRASCGGNFFLEFAAISTTRGLLSEFEEGGLLLGGNSFVKIVGKNSSFSLSGLEEACLLRRDLVGFDGIKFLRVVLRHFLLCLEELSLRLEFFNGGFELCVLHELDHLGVNTTFFFTAYFVCQSLCAFRTGRYTDTDRG